MIHTQRKFRVTNGGWPPSFHTEEKVIMKKFIQVCSLFSLLVLFSVASASAQSGGFGTDIQIPFAFNVGDHSYESGNYIVKLQRLSSGTASLMIQDTKNDEMQTVLLNSSGGAVDGEIKLVFDTIEGRRYLTKVRTADRSYALARPKVERDAAKSRNSEKASESSTVGGTADLF